MSINAVSGHLAILSCGELRLYSINGDILGSVRFGDDPIGPSTVLSTLSSSQPNSKMESAEIPRKRKSDGSSMNLSSLAWGRVVLAPPCSVWQDGVVAVTGHDSGLVCFWRLQTVQTTIDEGLKRQLIPSPLYLNAAQSTQQISSQCQITQQSQKKVPTNSYTHNAPITVLRLNPTVCIKSKELSDKTSQGGPFDLLVGDEKGFVSTWTLMKLDQFSPSELSLMVALKPPPPRDTPSSTLGSTSTLVGAANSFAPLGAASGLFKLLGASAGVITGNNNISNNQNQNQRHHETASALAARIQEIEDLSNEDHMDEFF